MASPDYGHSFLSPAVRALLSLPSHLQFLVVSTPPLIDSDNFKLDWSLIQLIASCEAEHVYNEVEHMARHHLVPIATYVHTILTKEVHVNLKTLYGLYSWTQCPELYVKCMECLLVKDSSSNESSLDIHLCLLLCTAAIERSLGDLFICLTKGKHKCPKLLKDLLATEELKKLFGDFPMLCLQCLIGPPKGFNLRNIAWHGFFTEGEIPECLVLFLLVIFGNLSHFIPSSIVVEHRSFIDFPQQILVQDIFPSFNEFEIIQELFHESLFIPTPMRSVWLKALNYYKQNNYGYFVSMILPCLEHSMRCVFAKCNKCPHRILTAESSTLYTTFDEILSSTLEDGHQLNQLPNEIGSSYMDLLMDLLVYPKGLRLRDRISHGEVDLTRVSKPLADFVLGIAVSFCGLYNKLNDANLERIVAIAKKYRSLYHPVSILKRQLIELLSEMSKWKVMNTYHAESDGELSVNSGFCDDYMETVHHILHQFTVWSTIDIVTEFSHIVIEESFDGFNVDPILRLVDRLWNQPIKTLYMDKHDLEITGLLQRLVTNLLSSIKQIPLTVTERYQLYCSKGLRSRQRANFDQLLSNIGLYWSSVLLACILVCIVVACYPILRIGADKILRFYKKVLQFSENFFSQSLPTKNCWEECEKYCMTLIDHCNKLCLTQSEKQNTLTKQ